MRKPEINETTAITILLVLSILVGTLVFLTSQQYDPHRNDEDYCYQYAVSLDWRMPVKYLVNKAIAEKVCTCAITYHNGTYINGEYNPPLYPWSTICKRRAGAV